MPDDIIARIRAELSALADEKTRNNYARFFKEQVVYYGVNNGVVEKIARQHFAEIKNLSKKEVFGMCEELFKSEFCEEAFIACEWVYRQRDQYADSDFPTLEKWVELYVHNWAVCDTLCNHTIGSFIDQYPQHTADLKRWAHSENRWLRRAAAVTLIIPAKQGKFLSDIFEIADILLMDTDDLVQKGYGWMLKDASIKHQAEVFGYVLKNRSVMPRTALRYAIERLPLEMKKQAMARAG
jgi:3-methyladenine DNA glycosylase AlkD